MRIIILCNVLFILSAFLCQAQDITLLEEGKKNILYFEEMSFGGRLHTSGWSIFYDRAKNMTYYKRKVYQIELGEIRHPKWKKQASSNTNPGIPGNTSPAKSFHYGKQHNFYQLKASIGRRRQIAQKGEKNGIEATYSYLFGPSLGILKPYTLNIIKLNPDRNNEIVKIRYSKEDEERFLDKDLIYGHAGFFHGIFRSKFVPGIQAKFGLNFDWAYYNERVKRVEMGVIAEAYLQEIPMMVETANNSNLNSFYFVNLYLSVQFGKRW